MRYYRSMPTKTREYLLFAPGNLVVCRTDVYSSTPIDGDAGNTNMIKAGTVGLIMERGDDKSGFKDHLRVQFLGKVLWWVRPDEVEPYVDYFYGRQV